MLFRYNLNSGKFAIKVIVSVGWKFIRGGIYQPLVFFSFAGDDGKYHKLLVDDQMFKEKVIFSLGYDNHYTYK